MSGDDRAEGEGRDRSPEWSDIARHFEAALPLSKAERRTYLERECGGDARLEGAVRELLVADARAPGFFEEGAARFAAAALKDGLWGDAGDRLAVGGESDRLGGYRLLEEIGRGGMSRVYLAEQEDDRLQRRVAVKRMTSIGRLREESERRFLAEGRVLAALDHPNIAQVFDAGVDDRGDPYLVMELVDGQPITDYCRSANLDLEWHIELFLQVCSAVQHAHQRLVVHRDLKPSNILVTPAGQVKLLDFGIAKLLDPALHAYESDAAVTRAGVVPMTPEYAAPEQIRGGEITTATDVYSLGLLLYQLLTRRLPYRVHGRTPSEIERVVCEVEPARPSTLAIGAEVAGAKAHGEGDSPPALAAPSWLPRLRGDLDAIVLQALAKEPGRRYGSAQELAADLRRYLQGLPVEARPPTRRYRLAKLVRRHRTAISTSAAVAAGVLLLIGFYTLRLQNERDQARIETRKGERVTSLLAGLFESSNPFAESSGEDLRARELLDRGTARVEEELGAEPEVQAALFDVLGNVYEGLGLYDQSRQLLERALALRRESAGASPAELAQSLRSLGRLLESMEELDASEALLRESLDLERKRGGESAEAASSLVLLGDLLWDRGDYASAESLQRQALELRRRLLGDDDVQVGESLHELGRTLAAQGDFAGAAELERRTLEVYRRHFGADHAHVAVTLNNLAYLAKRAGDYEEAESVYRQALDLTRRLLPANHPELAGVLSNLGILLGVMGRYDEAGPMLQEAFEILRDSLGESHPRVARALGNLSVLAQGEGDLEKAADYADRSLAIARQAYPPPHPAIATALNQAGSLALERGNYQDAERYFREALTMEKELYGEESGDVIGEMSNLGATLRMQGELAAAEPLLRRAIEIGRQVLGEEHPSVSFPLRQLGQLLAAAGRFDEGEAALREALEIQTQQGMQGRLPETREALADLYAAWGRPEMAAELRRPVESP